MKLSLVDEADVLAPPRQCVAQIHPWAMTGQWRSAPGFRRRRADAIIVPSGGLPSLHATFAGVSTRALDWSDRGWGSRALCVSGWLCEGALVHQEMLPRRSSAQGRSFRIEIGKGEAGGADRGSCRRSSILVRSLRAFDPGATKSARVQPRARSSGAPEPSPAALRRRDRQSLCTLNLKRGQHAPEPPRRAGAPEEPGPREHLGKSPQSGRPKVPPCRLCAYPDDVKRGAPPRASGAGGPRRCVAQAGAVRC